MHITGKHLPEQLLLIHLIFVVKNLKGVKN